MKRTLTMVVSILLIAVLLVGCSAKSKLIGSWEMEESGVTMTYTFEKGGKGEVDLGGVSVDFEWEVKGDKLTMEIAGEESEESEFKIKGDTLTIIDGDDEIELKKVKK